MSAVDDAAGVQKQPADHKARSSFLIEELFEQVPEAIVVFDKASRAVRVNREFVRTFGYRQDEIIGKAVSSLIVPKELQMEAEHIADSIAQRQTVSIETVRIRKDGRRIHVSMLGVPLDLSDRTVFGCSIYREITEHKVAEDLRADKADRLRLLLDVTNQVVSNLQLDDLLRAITASVRSVMQCDLVGVFLAEPEMNRLETFVLDFPGSKGLISEEQRFTSMEGSLGGLVFRTGKPWTGNAADVLQLGLTNEAAIPEGLKTGCVLPLVSRNRVLGVLGLGRREDSPFTQVDVDFLSQVANQIALAVENALAYREIHQLKEQLSKEKVYLQDEIRSEMNFAQIIGSSASLRKTLKRLQSVAPTDSTVLIYGETGTGKELIARAVHDLSPRKSKAFVKLNCAAIPTGLLESELFGHEKGAFTGAIAQRIGRFEVANGGTIFLDEIGEIPLELQTKLLRVLQEREFERLGSSRTLRTDARLIAATNRDLEVMVSEQKFRSDLFFRLNVFPVQVPSLREREEDIPLLVRHFAQQFSRRMNKTIETIPSATMDALCRYHWPGNIRELQNVIERAVILSTGPELNLDVADLKLSTTGKAPQSPTASNAKTKGTLRDVLQETERQRIIDALQQCNWVVAGANGAAARLGMNRSTLQVRMRKLRISRRSA
jgi:formate hydrogenlyase transcriptional activator